jgi:hypothetical protein
MTIKINPGKNYQDVKKIGFLSLKLIPQMAVWVENADGKLVKTIYVTKKAARSEWGGGINVNRPEALPVWAFKRGIPNSLGGFMPGGKNLIPDAETGASPAASFDKKWNVPSDLPDGKYKVLVEVNASFDYNTVYSEKLKKDDPHYNGVNGQPSLVLAGEINIGSSPSRIVLQNAGKGDPQGKNGNLDSDLSGITTALNLLESVSVDYTPIK